MTTDAFAGAASDQGKPATSPVPATREEAIAAIRDDNDAVAKTIARWAIQYFTRRKDKKDLAEDLKYWLDLAEKGYLDFLRDALIEDPGVLMSMSNKVYAKIRRAAWPEHEDGPTPAAYQ